MEISALLIVILQFTTCCMYTTSASRPTPREAKTTQFIKTSCSTTIYPHLCYNSLSIYATKIQTSPKQLANTSLTVALKTTGSTSSMINNLTKNSASFTPKEVAALLDCVEEISDSIYELQRSIKEMKGGGSSNFGLQMSNIQTWVSSALTNEDTCMDGFSVEGKNGVGGVERKVRRHIVRVAHMTSNALALINNYASSQTKTTQFIKTSCSATIYPHLCYNSLSIYATKIQTSPKQLANTSLTVALKTTGSTSSMINNLTKNSASFTPKEVAALRDCVEEISDSIYELQRSIKEMKGGGSSNFGLQMSNIQTWVSSALTNEDTCMDGFSVEGKNGVGGVKRKVRRHIVRVAHMTSNALALINNYASSQTKTTQFIKTSCSATIYPHLCYNSLSIYATKIQTSPKQLANTSLTVALRTTGSTSSMINNLTKNSASFTPKEVAALRDCVEEINDSIYELQRSIKEMNGGGRSNFGLQMSNIQTWVSSALTNEDTCMDGFSVEGKNGVGDVKRKVRRHIVRVAHMTSNALALINNYASSQTFSSSPYN